MNGQEKFPGEKKFIRFLPELIHLNGFMIKIIRYQVEMIVPGLIILYFHQLKARRDHCRLM